jgi:hypothetical protein
MVRKDEEMGSKAYSVHSVHEKQKQSSEEKNRNRAEKE